MADLIAFVENSARHQQHGYPSQQQQRQRVASSGTCSDVGKPSHRQSSLVAPPPSPSSALPAPNRNPSSTKRPEKIRHADNTHSSPATAGFSTPFVHPAARSGPPPPPQQQPPSPATPKASPASFSTAGRESAGLSADSNGEDLLSPRVVPLTSKWDLSSSPAAPDSKGLRDGIAGTNPSPAVRGRGREGTCAQGNPVPDRRSEDCCVGQERAAEEVRGGDGDSCARGGGHCTTLVKHLGAVLGLRGRDAYRRPGRPGQPVWRKRETLIQERIVQYTTLDEEGTVRVSTQQ